VASGADSRGGLPGGKQRPRATAFALEDPTIMGLMQRSILEAGHSSQHMTTRYGDRMLRSTLPPGLSH
jgi:hypothetical protein